MKQPRQIDILGKDYCIEPCAKKYDNEDAMGQCIYHGQMIFLNNEMQKDATLETLLHESIHAIEGELKLKLKEIQVRTLSTALYAVLKENPDIWKMIWRKR